MSNIYDQYDRAFANVTAYVVLDGTNRVATIAIKHPTDGAGRMHAYVHWLGTEMVRGFASGYGYDKRSAAIAAAGQKLPANTGDPERYDDFYAAVRMDDGYGPIYYLEKAGFTVLQAV